MLDTLIASYCGTYLLLGYIKLMDELSSYVDKKIINKDKERMQKLLNVKTEDEKEVQPVNESEKYLEQEIKK